MAGRMTFRPLSRALVIHSSQVTCDVATGSPNAVQFFTSDETPGSLAIALSSIYGAMHSMTTRAQCLSYYLSIVGLAFPSMRESCHDLMQKMGYVVQELSLPRDSHLVGFVAGPSERSRETCMMIIAQLLMILFKETGGRDSPYSHADTLSIWLREVAAVVGGLDSEVPDPLGYEQAQLIKIVLGNDYTLRKSLLKSILETATEHRDERMVRMCMYLANTFRYAGMETLCLINDTLTNPISSVLKDPRMISEVENYVAAVEKVFTAYWSSEYRSVGDRVRGDPGSYYRVIGDRASYYLLEPNRFPTLLSVATKLYARIHPSYARSPLTAVSKNTFLIDQLIALHDRTIGTVSVLQGNAPATGPRLRRLRLASAP